MHQSDEFLSPALLDVEALANVGQALDQLFGGYVAINPRQGRVGHQIAPRRRRLEYPFHQVVEDAVVFLLRFKQGHVHPVPPDGVRDWAFQPRWRELALNQVILSPRMYRFEGNDFIVRVSDSDDG